MASCPQRLGVMWCELAADEARPLRENGPRKRQGPIISLEGIRPSVF